MARQKLYDLTVAGALAGVSPIALELLIDWGKIPDRLSRRVTLEEVQAVKVTVAEANRLFNFSPQACRLYQQIRGGFLAKTETINGIALVTVGDVAKVAAVSDPRRGPRE